MLADKGLIIWFLSGLHIGKKLLTSTIKKKKKGEGKLISCGDSLMVWLQFPVCGSSFCSKLTNQVTNVYELPTNDWVSGTCICIFLTLCLLERDMSLVSPFSTGNSSPTQNSALGSALRVMSILVLSFIYCCVLFTIATSIAICYICLLLHFRVK